MTSKVGWEYYSAGFDYAMGFDIPKRFLKRIEVDEVNEADNLVKRFRQGEEVALDLAAVFGGARGVKQKLDAAPKLQEIAAKISKQVPDRAPPCDSCKFIGICKATSLTCGRFRSYVGKGEHGAGLKTVPDESLFDL